MNKEIVHRALEKEIDRRIIQLNELLKDAYDSVAGDSKSSAGDKHETGRAMAQLEQEKIGAQLGEMEKLRNIVQRIAPKNSHSMIQAGSLVKTSNGWFYLAAGIGIITVEKNQIFCMTTAAPLGKILIGKKQGDEIEWQGKKIEIQQVS